MTWLDCLESLAYLEQEPELSTRVDVGLAQVAAGLAALAGRKRARLRDFLPPWWRNQWQEPTRDPARVEAVLMAFAERHNRARKGRG